MEPFQRIQSVWATICARLAREDPMWMIQQTCDEEDGNLVDVPANVLEHIPEFLKQSQRPPAFDCTTLWDTLDHRRELGQVCQLVRKEWEAKHATQDAAQVDLFYSTRPATLATRMLRTGGLDQSKTALGFDVPTEERRTFWANILDTLLGLPHVTPIDEAFAPLQEPYMFGAQ